MQKQEYDIQFPFWKKINRHYRNVGNVIISPERVFIKKYINGYTIIMEYPFESHPSQINVSTRIHMDVCSSNGEQTFEYYIIFRDLLNKYLHSDKYNLCQYSNGIVDYTIAVIDLLLAFSNLSIRDHLSDLKHTLIEHNLPTLETIDSDPLYTISETDKEYQIYDANGALKNVLNELILSYAKTLI